MLDWNCSMAKVLLRAAKVRSGFNAETPDICYSATSPEIASCNGVLTVSNTLAQLTGNFPFSWITQAMRTPRVLAVWMAPERISTDRTGCPSIDRAELFWMLLAPL